MCEAGKRQVASGEHSAVQRVRQQRTRQGIRALVTGVLPQTPLEYADPPRELVALGGPLVVVQMAQPSAVDSVPDNLLPAVCQKRGIRGVIAAMVTAEPSVTNPRNSVRS